ncbi:MAG TPA: polymer-forming cytoskeletal protein [Nitrospiraceae bacterium]|nr:polymer-forming cytoskeletal protein [Nitrospiraceae bacterium]
MNGQSGQNRADLEATTVVRVDTIIIGTIRAKGMVWIDGRVEGDICTNDLLMISETGMVIGNIEAGSVICRGMIMGDVVASEEVELLESASLNGTVRAPLFSVDDSALINDNMDAACAVEELSDDEGALPSAQWRNASPSHRIF